MSNKIPVYTLLTGDEAIAWIRANYSRADEFLKAAQEAKLPMKDAVMAHVLTAMAMCKAGGWNVREFVAIVEQFLPPLEHES